MKTFICAILLACCLITGITLLSIWSDTTDPTYSQLQQPYPVWGIA